MSLYEVRDLKIEFPTPGGTVQAVRGVSFDIGENECVALVGESGCGKSVTARSLIGLTEVVGGRVAGGQIFFEGENILDFSERKWRSYRGARAAMIFQDAMTALNPTMRIGKQIWECFRFHQKLGRKEAEQKAAELLEMVSIPNPQSALRRYPHEFSGGMRQRVVIAQALACNPSLLIADEPTTALDVTIQAQILDLLQKLQRERGMGMLFVTHNLGVVAEIAQRVAVMYAGRIVETGPVAEVFRNPLHPYTMGLLKSMPRLGAATEMKRNGEKLNAIPGMVPSLANMPTGCAFAPRCPFAIDACSRAVPELAAVNEAHGSRCIRWQEIAA